jgi:hypothetical protein
MVAAAVAATAVSVAATAASTAMSATAKGPKTPTLGAASGLEGRLDRRDRDLLGYRERLATGSIMERRMLMPELYRQAGYDVTYDEDSMARARDARQRADDVAARFAEAKARLEETTGAGRRAALQGLKGRERRLKGRELRKATRQARIELRRTRASMDTMNQAALAAEQSAGTITGLQYRGLGTEDDRAIEALMTSRVRSALETGKSDDPRLTRELAEAEGEIRARLARQYGVDYENTSGGQMALSAFRQRKAESLADFARRDVDEYQKARLGQRETLGRIAAQSMGLSLAPTNAAFESGSELDRVLNTMRGLSTKLQRDRLAQFEGAMQGSKADYAAQQARDQNTMAGLSALAQGASGLAGLAADSTNPNPRSRIY